MDFGFRFQYLNDINNRLIKRERQRQAFNSKSRLRTKRHRDFNQNTLYLKCQKGGDHGDAVRSFRQTSNYRAKNASIFYRH